MIREAVLREIEGFSRQHATGRPDTLLLGAAHWPALREELAEAFGLAGKYAEAFRTRRLAELPEGTEVYGLAVRVHGDGDTLLAVQALCVCEWCSRDVSVSPLANQQRAAELSDISPDMSAKISSPVEFPESRTCACGDPECIYA